MRTNSTTQATSNPSAAVVGGVVVAECLTSSDPFFVGEIEASASRGYAGEVCQQVFELGISVRQLATRSSDVVELKSQVEAAERQIGDAVEHALTAISEQIALVADADGGAIRVAVSAEMDRLEATLGALFDPDSNDGAPAAIRASVDEVVQQSLRTGVETLVKIVNPSDDNGPFGRVARDLKQSVVTPVAELVRRVEALTTAIEIREAVGVERERGTAKGREYEQSVLEATNAKAAVTGDIVTAVGDSAGSLAGSKKGDIVVDVLDGNTACGRIVIEAKASKLSRAAALKELEQSAENRQAAVGIMVFSSSEQTPGCLPFVRFEPGRYGVVYEAGGDDLGHPRLLPKLGALPRAPHKSTSRRRPRCDPRRALPCGHGNGPSALLDIRVLATTSDLSQIRHSALVGSTPSPELNQVQ